MVDKLAAASPLLASLAKQTRQQPGRKRPRQQRQQAGSGAAAAGAGVRSPAGAHGSSCEEIDLAGASSGSELPSSTSTAAESDDGGSSSSSADLRSKRRRSAAPRHPGGAAARQQQQPPPPQQQAPGTMVTAEGGGAPLPGFVRCPVCNKAVPAFYINSHVDQCLAGGQEPAAGVGGGGTAPAGRQKLQQGVAAEPFEPLAVPVKLVPNLASERSLRQLLKRYSLPTDGKKKVCSLGMMLYGACAGTALRKPGHPASTAASLPAGAAGPVYKDAAGCGDGQRQAGAQGAAAWNGCQPGQMRGCP